MKRISILLFVLAIALGTQAQTVKFTQYQNATSSDTGTYKSGRIFYNPTVGKFSFMEGGVTKHLFSSSTTFPANAPGVLTNNGSGTLSWQSYLKPDGSTPLTSNWNVGAYRITNLHQPIFDQDAATKKYTDSVAQKFVGKKVFLATTDTLPANTYSNGTLGVGATLTATRNGVLAVDGSAPSLNDRILVKNEANAAYNGIYVLTTVGSVSVPYVLTRATDCDEAIEIPSSLAIVSDGITNSTSEWVSIGSSFIMGTTLIYWTQFTQITAGIGLSGTTVFNVNTSQNITQLSNLITKGLVLTDASGNLSSNHGLGYVKSDALGNISFDNSTFLTSETDPIYSVSSWFSTINNSSNWDDAFNRAAYSLSFTSSTFTLTKQNTSTLTASVPTFNQNTTGSSGSVINALSISAELISGGASSYNGSAAKSIAIQPTSVTNGMLSGSIASNKLVGTDIATVGTITSGTWNGTRLTSSYIPQGSALSVLGVSGNAITDQASIVAASDFQILRRSGTSIGFGPIDLSQSNSVGTSILGVDNGGTGSASQNWWGLSGTSTLTGSATITSNASSQHTFNGTWTNSGSQQFHIRSIPAITTSTTSTLTHFFGPTFTLASTNQIANNIFAKSTYSIPAGPVSNTQYVSLNWVVTNGTYNNVAATSQTGSGTGALFNFTITANGVTVTIVIANAGTGYVVGDQLTFAASAVGGGTGNLVLEVTGVTGYSLTSTSSVLSLQTSLGNSSQSNLLQFLNGSGTNAGAIKISHGYDPSGLSILDQIQFHDNTGSNFVIASNGTFFNRAIRMLSTLNVVGAVSLASTLSAGTSTLGSTSVSSLSATGSVSFANGLSSVIISPNFSGSSTGKLQINSSNTLTASGSLASVYISGSPAHGVLAAGTGGGTITNAGTGGTNGTYTAVPLTGGSGSNAQATITVSGNVVTSVNITAQGFNYKTTEILSAASGNIGGVTGFQWTIGTVDFGGTHAGLYDNRSYIVANGANRFVNILLTPTINQSSNATGNIYAIRYTGIHTAILGTQYSFVYENTGSVGGIGSASPDATWYIKGSGSVPTLKTIDVGTGTNYSIQALQSDGVTQILGLQGNGDFKVGLSSSKWGMFGSSPVAQQSVLTTLVNNVALGGTTSTIANYTDLSVYANDAATIRNNFYQLTKKVLALETALRNYNIIKD